MDGRQAAAEIIRSLRERHHLTQRDLAQLAGVPQPTISSIESGKREPSLSLLSSIVESVGEALRIGVVPATPFSGVATSDAIRHLIRRSETGDAVDDSILRRLLSFRDVIQQASPEEVIDLITSPPSLIGDARWDACVAAVVEEECARRDVAPPRWVNDAQRFVKPFWFLSKIPALHQWEFETAPTAFIRHGVIAAADELASV